MGIRGKASPAHSKLDRPGGLTWFLCRYLQARGLDLSRVRTCVVVAEERPRIALTQSFSKLFKDLGLHPRAVSTSFGCRVNLAICLQVRFPSWKLPGWARPTGSRRLPGLMLSYLQKRSLSHTHAVGADLCVFTLQSAFVSIFITSIHSTYCVLEHFNFCDRRSSLSRPLLWDFLKIRY